MRARGQCKFLWSLEPGHAGASTQVDHIELAVPGAPAESSLSAKRHPIAMSVDEMAVVEGRFSPARIRGRLQGDLSGVAQARETAGAPHGSAGGPCAVNWIRVRSASVRENSRARRPDLSRGQQHRRPSHTSSRAGSWVTWTSCSFEFASATYGIL